MITAQEFFKNVVVFFGSAQQHIEYITLPNPKTYFCFYSHNSHKIGKKDLTEKDFQKVINQHLPNTGGFYVYLTLLNENKANIVFKFFEENSYSAPKSLLKVGFPAIDPDVIELSNDPLEVTNSDKIIMPLNAKDGEELLQYNKHLINYSPDLHKLMLHTLKYPPIESTLEDIRQRVVAIEDKLNNINKHATSSKVQKNNDEASSNNRLHQQESKGSLLQTLYKFFSSHLEKIILVFISILILILGIFIVVIFGGLNMLTPPPTNGNVNTPKPSNTGSLEQLQTNVTRQTNAISTNTISTTGQSESESPAPQEVQPKSNEAQEITLVFSLAENTKLVSVSTKIEIEGKEQSYIVTKEEPKKFTSQEPINLNLAKFPSDFSFDGGNVEIEKKFRLPKSEKFSVDKDTEIKLLAISVRSDLANDKVFVNGEEEGPTGVYLIVQQGIEYKIEVQNADNSKSAKDTFTFTQDSTITACLKNQEELKETTGYNARASCP